MYAISVIIATKNRSEALETISLPSLAKQDFKDFEIIVWDASDDDSSKKVVEEFEKEHLDMDIKYFKAPRVGLPSQRNDAVKVAKGEIVFFMDDDSEVSSDGLSALLETFEDKTVFGAGLRLKKIQNKQGKQDKLKSFFQIFYYVIFRMQHGRKKAGRIVMMSGWQIWQNQNDEEDFSERIEWLSGCSMGFRKKVFENSSFEEKLQKFGGYALGEDLQFSHRIFRNKMKLALAKKGYVIHHQVEGGRLIKREMLAAQIYNQFLIWKTAVYPYNRLSLFVYLWSLLGETIRFYLAGILKNKEKVKGISLGLHAILNEIFDKTSHEQI